MFLILFAALIIALVVAHLIVWRHLRVTSQYNGDPVGLIWMNCVTFAMIYWLVAWCITDPYSGIPAVALAWPPTLLLVGVPMISGYEGALKMARRQSEPEASLN